MAVLALVVVNALAESPWGVFSIALTIPIALFMGFYVRSMRPGAVMEATAIGVALLLLAIIGGSYVDELGLAESLTLSPETRRICLALYGFVASILPVWMLLARVGAPPVREISVLSSIDCAAAVRSPGVIVNPRRYSRTRR